MCMHVPVSRGSAVHKHPISTQVYISCDLHSMKQALEIQTAEIALGVYTGVTSHNSGASYLH